MPHTSHNRPLSRNEFDSMYRDLADAWMSHQALKTAHAPIAQLVDSNFRIYQTRMAMGSWRHQTRR